MTKIPTGSCQISPLHLAARMREIDKSRLRAICSITLKCEIRNIGKFIHIVFFSVNKKGNRWASRNWSFSMVILEAISNLRRVNVRACSKSDGRFKFAGIFKSGGMFKFDGRFFFWRRPNLSCLLNLRLFLNSDGLSNLIGFLNSMGVFIYDGHF